MSTTPARKRATLKIVLAGVAIVGVGAAITTAAWTDDVLFDAEATASSFDLQHSATGDPGEWSDLGVPGGGVVTIDAAGLDALSPGATVDVPFFLCNIGTADGTVSVTAGPVTGDPLGTAAGAELILTIDLPTDVPSDPTCASPVEGTLTVEATDDFPPTAQGLTGTITFTVTGTSV